MPTNCYYSYRYIPSVDNKIALSGTSYGGVQDYLDAMSEVNYLYLNANRVASKLLEIQKSAYLVDRRGRFVT